MVDTLKYLKMGGRLSGGAAAIGGLLGIKPIVTALDGKIEAVAKARGKAAALAWIAEKVAAGGKRGYTAAPPPTLRP